MAHIEDVPDDDCVIPDIPDLSPVPYDQQKHPELRPGERWLTNIGKRGGLFKEIHYTTKRLGTIAYTMYGDVSESSVPVFVRKDEIVDGMLP